MLLAVLSGLLLGLLLGALGGGGSILAVPVLAYLLGQPALEATTGSLVIVGVSAAMGALAAHRRGQVRLGRGLVFAVIAMVGAGVGSRVSTMLAPELLMALFGALMLVVATVMLLRQRRRGAADEAAVVRPLLSRRGGFSCDCERVAVLVLAAVTVGFLTGLLGVGGGFLVVPALVLALGLTMRQAVGTSLLVIALTSATAFAGRMLHGVDLDWPVLVLLTLVSVMGSLAGARLAARVDQRRLSLAFVVLLFVVAGYTTLRTWPVLLS